MAFEDILQSILGDEYTGTPSVFGGNNLWDDYSPSPTVPSVTYDEPSGVGSLFGDLGTTDVSFWDMMGDDWSIPVGSETGDPITAGDITYGDDWLSDFWSDMGAGDLGEDWWTPVGSETGDPITEVNYGNTFLDDLLASILQPGTYDPTTGVGTGGVPAAATNGAAAAGGDPADPADPAAELTGWQKFLQSIIGKGGGPFGGSILGPQGEGDTQGVLGGILSLLGIGGGGGILGGGAGEEGAGGGIGGLFGSNPLMAFLMMKSLMKDDKSPGDIIPVGQQAYGEREAYNMPDYRVTNLKPALMPGVGYANMAQPQQPTAMEQGGLAGLMGYQGGGRTMNPRAAAAAAMIRNAPPPPRAQQRIRFEGPNWPFNRGNGDRPLEAPEVWPVPPGGQTGGVVAPPAVAPANLGPLPGSPAAQAGYVSPYPSGGGSVGSTYGIIPRYQPPAPTLRQGQMQAYQTGAAPRGGGRGWKEGGLTSLSEGPGDVTLAKLEPGEFVMTRKATQNIGAKNLYDLMKRAEGRGG